MYALRLLLLLILLAHLASCDEPRTEAPIDVSPADIDPQSCGLLVCAAGERCCDYACVDITASGEHCGGCGITCSASESCSAGVCTCGRETCGVDTLCCDEGGTPACVAALSDTANCGGCGVVCGVGEQCIAGGCACISVNGSLESCREGESCCPGLGCLNLSTDALSCGVCGAACGAGELCSDGRCTCGGTDAEPGLAACAAGESCCGSPAQCIDESCCGSPAQCIDGEL